MGQPLTISVKVTNHGPDAAAGVVLDNLFPSNLTYVSDDGGGAFDPATGTWTIGALPLDATVTLTLSATAATVGSSSDGASAVTTTFEADLTNNADSWPLEVHPSADLSLTKSVDNAIPHNGETVTYTISVANAGPNAATGVIVADLLPAGLAWASDDGAGAYLHASGTWTIGAIANGATATLHITALVQTTGPLANTGEIVASDDFDPDSTPANADPAEDDQATATVNAQASADLSVTKTVDDATPNVGDVVTFTVTVHDAGPDDAHGVSVADVMPAGLVYVSDDGAGAYEPISGTWTIGTLAAGADTVIHMSATVTQSGPLVNTATVSATTYDPDLANNAASTSPAAAVAADLGVTDSVNDHTPSLGDLVTYTVVVTNHGPDLGTGVAVDFPIPAGFSYVSDDAAGA